MRVGVRVGVRVRVRVAARSSEALRLMALVARASSSASVRKMSWRW